jgi:hypothetical protein
MKTKREAGSRSASKGIPDAQHRTPKAEMFRTRWIQKFIDLVDPDLFPYPDPCISSEI